MNPLYEIALNIGLTADQLAAQMAALANELNQAAANGITLLSGWGSVL